MADRGEKLQQLHCYHPFSDSRDIYLTKNHYENYSPKMVPTNPIGSWTKCSLYCLEDIQILLKFIPRILLTNMSALVWVMAGHMSGDKPCPRLMITKITDSLLGPVGKCCNGLRIPWWRHQMETFSALLAICAGNSPASGEFPAQRPVTRSFDVFFDLCLNKRLRKQSWGWRFETLSRPLWRHCNSTIISYQTCTQSNYPMIHISKFFSSTFWTPCHLEPICAPKVSK